MRPPTRNGLAEPKADVDEWIAGWYHHFVSPKDGSSLTFTPDEPEPETLHSRSDPKVTLTIESDALKDQVRIVTKDGKTHDLGFLLYLMGKAEQLPANFVPEPDPTKIQPVPGLQYWKDVSRADHYHRSKGDVALMKDLGLKADRSSIS